MKWSLFGFVARRVGSSLRERIGTHCLTAGTMAMALFVFGAFLLLQENLERFFEGWGDQIQVQIYLDRNLGDADRRALLDRLRGLPEVERVSYISREQAWKDFRAALGPQSGVLDGLPADVLPASFEISLKPAFRDGRMIAELAERLRRHTGVAGVEYPQEWAERLSLVILAVQWGKWVIGGVLFMVTFFIVGATVRLAILARKSEIEIMQLVGASEELIQAPFVLEGMAQGLAGAGLSLAALWGLYAFLRSQLAALGLWTPGQEPEFLHPKSVALLLGIGWVLGASGSAFSLRRFLTRTEHR